MSADDPVGKALRRVVGEGVEGDVALAAGGGVVMKVEAFGAVPVFFHPVVPLLRRDFGFAGGAMDRAEVLAAVDELEFAVVFDAGFGGVQHLGQCIAEGVRRFRERRMWIGGEEGEEVLAHQSRDRLR